MVKLSDVGLSRTLTSSDYYRKVSDNKVPVKWMAPESILERLYTSASDVWSFGVLCWEVYSLGETPYRGMRAEQVLLAVESGFRMIERCWALEPSERPTFKRIHVEYDRLTVKETRI
jgi:proto-oncogene tyrosine-protein kinase Ret